MTKKKKPEVEDEIMKDFDFETVDNCCFISTFKIYQQTGFDELKIAACEFWGVKHYDEMVLTDEWFNVVSTYKDTVQNFFCKESKY